MIYELVLDWWWAILPAVGLFGSNNLNPASIFSSDFAKSSRGQSTRGYVPNPAKGERRLIRGLQGLNQQQLEAIIAGLNQARLPVSFQSLDLNAQDQATLDQAYAGAEANMRRQAGLLGQDLASTRGLNMSDTPVSEVVMREFLPAALQLQGQKAQESLGLGLNMRQLGENARQFNLSSLFSGSQITPTSGLALMGNYERTRMARGGQNVNGWNIGSPVDTGLKMSEMYKNAMSGSSGFIGASDERLKRDIRPVAWHWKQGNDKEYLGVVAQEIQQSHPHLVSEDAQGSLLVNYGAMVAMLLSEREALYNRLAQYEGAA